MTHRTPLDIETGDAADLYRLPAMSPYIRLVGIGSTAFVFGNGRTVPRGAGLPTATVNGHFFDMPALERHAGIPVEQTIPFSRDLRVAAFQHDPPTTRETGPGPSFKSYAMSALTERYLGEDSKSDLGKALAKEYGGWGRISVDDSRFTEYLLSDLANTARLDEAIPYDPYEEREAWVCTVTARATLNGFAVDLPGLTARAAHLAERADAGRALLAERFGFPLTLDSGKPASAPQRTKAGKAAFESALTSFGIDLTSWPRCKDRTLSLAKEVLEKVAEWGQANAHPSLPVVEAVQEMNGIRNNAANLLRWTGADGRVHSRFEPFQSTGRWSVQDPGLTVLKKGVEDSERMYLTADPGEVLISIDADQVDIRCAAAHAQDPALIALLNDPERDIHTEISAMARVPRQQGKTFDLGWLYGRSAKAMGEMKGADPEAADAVVAYMAGTFPLVRVWQDKVRAMGEAGVLLDNGFGRRLRVDPLRSYTQAPAMIGQSTTRDIIARCLIELARRAPECLPMLRVIVHDELVLSVPAAHAQEIGELVRSCMSCEWAPAGASIPVRFTAGRGPVKTAHRWGELYL